MSGTQTAITLKDILLGISESLNDAQNQLRNMPPYDEFGRPNVLYTLPYLDFEVKVDAAIQETTNTKPSASVTEPSPFSSDSNPQFQRRSAYADKYAVQAKPALKWTLPRIAGTTSSSSKTSEANLSSSISGRFVAVAPNEGLPQIFLQETIISEIPREFTIKVLVSNSAGEKIPGVKVEINFVSEDSDPFSSTPQFSAAEVYTSNTQGDDYGVATITVNFSIADEEKRGVFEINTGPISKLISIN